MKESAKSACKSFGYAFYSSPYTDPNGAPVLEVGISSNGDHFVFLYGDGARFAIDKHGREIWGDWPENYAFEEACASLLGPVIAFALRLRGVVCLHASSVAIDGMAIAVIGEPGAGKSTTAAAFAQLGYSVLSDDVAVLTDQRDSFLVQPGYPRVNLWPDSVRELFGSEDALPQIAPTWEKKYLALDGNGYRFQPTPLRLGAIFVLDERVAALSYAQIKKLSDSEAFMKLVANTYVNYLLDADMRKHEFGVLSRIVADVSVLSVQAPSDPSKVFDLCQRIAQDARQVEREAKKAPATKAC